MFYDKYGNEIELEDYNILKLGIYRVVGRAVLSDGKVVSTVWLGVDQNLTDEGPPLIFETFVFENRECESSIFFERYSSLEEAEKGFLNTVKLYEESISSECDLTTSEFKLICEIRSAWAKHEESIRKEWQKAFNECFPGDVSDNPRPEDLIDSVNYLRKFGT